MAMGYEPILTGNDKIQPAELKVQQFVMKQVGMNNILNLCTCATIINSARSDSTNAKGSRFIEMFQIFLLNSIYWLLSRFYF